MILTAQQNLSAGMSAAYRAIAPAASLSRPSNRSTTIWSRWCVACVSWLPPRDGATSTCVLRPHRTSGDSSRVRHLDFDDMRVDRIDPAGGERPPPDKTLLIERGSMEAGLGMDGRAIGGTMLIEPPNRKLREMTISGLAHDLSSRPR